MRSGARGWWVLGCLVLLFMAGCVKRTGKDPAADGMFGKVVDRNEQPIRNAKIRVSPGNIDVITNRWGEFQVLHGFDASGGREPLKTGQSYTIDVFQPGFHQSVQVVTYDGGSQDLPTVTLVEESIPLTDEKGADEKALIDTAKGRNVGPGGGEPGVSAIGE